MQVISGVKGVQRHRAKTHRVTSLASRAGWGPRNTTNAAHDHLRELRVAVRDPASA